MSVPPEVMQMMQRSQQAQQQGMPPSGVDNNHAPAAAGMATPQPKNGDEGAAKANIHIAMNMLEQALTVFGSESEEGKALLSVLTKLAHKFGDSGSGDLVPAQIMQMVKAEPSLSGGKMQQMMQQAQGQQGPR